MPLHFVFASDSLAFAAFGFSLMGFVCLQLQLHNTPGEGAGTFWHLYHVQLQLPYDLDGYGMPESNLSDCGMLQLVAAGTGPSAWACCILNSVEDAQSCMNWTG